MQGQGYNPIYSILTVPCMDYYTIEEHKVYWVEAMEVLVDNEICLCEDSKAMWNEAVELSLDIYR